MYGMSMFGRLVFECFDPESIEVASWATGTGCGGLSSIELPPAFHTHRASVARIYSLHSHLYLPPASSCPRRIQSTAAQEGAGFTLASAASIFLFGIRSTSSEGAQNVLTSCPPSKPDLPILPPLAPSRGDLPLTQLARDDCHAMALSSKHTSARLPLRPCKRRQDHSADV